MRPRRLARAALYGGIVVTVIGLSELHGNLVADPPYDFTGSSRFAWAIAYIVLLAVTAYGAGLPDLPRRPRSAVVTALGAAGAAALGISLVQLAVGDALLPRFVVFGSAVVLVPWYVLCTGLAAGGRARDLDRDQIVVVAPSPEAELLGEDLELAPERPATVVAVLAPAEAAAVEEGHRPLEEAVGRTGATVVVLDRAAQADERIVVQAADLHSRGVRVRTLSLFYEQWLGKLPITELERVSMLFDIGEVHRARYGRVTRLLDVVLAILGLIPLALAVPFVAVGDLVANRGPLLYRQERVGKGGATFAILKFRTMEPGGGDRPGAWTRADDPRVTPFGHLLRVTHLDELPQLLNVLRGDLAIVGPRPEQPHYVEELREKLPFYDVRHLVRPGITGWAQVKYGYAGDERDALEKLQYEFFYLRHQTLTLDVRIIGRTIRSVLGRDGR